MKTDNALYEGFHKLLAGRLPSDGQALNAKLELAPAMPHLRSVRLRH